MSESKTASLPAGKPVTLKVVKTRGGYAVYFKTTTLNPDAVFTSAFDVLDWMADRLAELEPAGGLTGRPAGG